MIIGSWRLNQTNKITFVLVDATITEVSGLGATFSLFISKNGGAFAPSTGVKAETGNGWYSYIATALESDTIGTISIYITAPGTIQQNLEYVVQQRQAGCIPFTYTALHSVTLLPLQNVEIWVSTDNAGVNVIWYGKTNAFGVALDTYGNVPCLDPGTYYFWKERPGMTDDDNPDVEVVS